MFDTNVAINLFLIILLVVALGVTVVNLALNLLEVKASIREVAEEAEKTETCPQTRRMGRRAFGGREIYPLPGLRGSAQKPTQKMRYLPAGFDPRVLVQEVQKREAEASQQKAVWAAQMAVLSLMYGDNPPF